ncbi:MAG: hypothetical protein M3T56_05740 [Chloroflexota bacterium]|nr:hypothetical protein [Chloroflexota bacterium]
MTRLLGSLALAIGGVAWVGYALALSGERYGDAAGVRLLRPAESLSSTYRGGADAAPYLAAAVVLTLVGFALLYGRAAWLAGSWGKASVVMLALGALVLVMLLVPSVPLFVGWPFYLLGMLALGIASLRTGVLPRSAAWMLIGAAIVLFFFNTEDDRALLAIAPGLAWATLGARSLMSAAR